MKYKVKPGFSEAHRTQVADLFWGAFAQKLAAALGPAQKAVTFIAPNLQPAFAFSAIAADGSLLGVAGIKTEKGGLLTGSLWDLSKVYGLFGALWRGVLLDMFERPLADGTLLMDGIFVSPNAQGQGVGTQLLDAVIWTARMNRYARVRLDVIDTNPRARALYERTGFLPVEVVKTGAMASIFGFQSATTMELDLSGPSQTSPSPGPAA